MDFISAQIGAGESEEAATYLQARVDEIETLHHRYHEDLVAPLTLLGDAKLTQAEYDEALDYYGRAKHIARVSHGLFDSRQIPVVYREAQAYRAMGDMAQSAQSEEYAYEVARQAFQPNDARLIEPTARLAGFYLSTMNPLAARILYNRALMVVDANDQGNSEAAIPILTGVADSHLQERFPPVYIASADDSQLQGATANFRTFNSATPYPSINTFAAGEEALQRIIEIRQADPDHPELEIDALLRLADWHLMFGRATNAGTLYEYTWNRMLEMQSDPSTEFARPKLIYFPLPDDPRAPPADKRGTATEGTVTLGFDVNAYGKVRKLKTIDAQPPKLMDFRVRRSMRSAVFRPMLVDGIAVDAEEQTYTHRYTYFPDLQDTNSQASETPEASP